MDHIEYYMVHYYVVFRCIDMSFIMQAHITFQVLFAVVVIKHYFEGTRKSHACPCNNKETLMKMAKSIIWLHREFMM